MWLGSQDIKVKELALLLWIGHFMCDAAERSVIVDAA